MEVHALELLHLTVWLIGGLGALIALLLGAIVALARWGGIHLFERLGEQDKTMGEIKELLTSETRLLRDAQHAVIVRVVKLEEFRTQIENGGHYHRRSTDVEGMGEND